MHWLASFRCWRTSGVTQGARRRLLVRFDERFVADEDAFREEVALTPVIAESPSASRPDEPPWRLGCDKMPPRPES